MVFYVNLFFGIIFISTASKISSQCIDKLETERILFTNNEKIMTEMRNLTKSFNVQLSTIPLIYEKVKKLEGTSVSSIEKISSEGETMSSALGNDTSNDTLTYDRVKKLEGTSVSSIEKISSEDENLSSPLGNDTSNDILTYDREEQIGTENLILLKLEEIFTRIKVVEGHLSKIEVYKPIERNNFFVTPKLNYESAVKYCQDNDGRPFIPQKQEHFDFYIELSSFNTFTPRLAWYPLNDIEEEGHLVYQDGTDFRNAWFKIKTYDEDAYKVHENGDEYDCVGVDGGGDAGWIKCSEDWHVMVCQRN